MNKLQKAEQIIDKARKSISEFCINECNAYCCKKGYIMVRENQLNTIATKEEQELLKNEGKLKEFEFAGKFQINFDNSLGGCPALKENKCTVHENPLRPRICHEFPIFVQGDEIKISPKCPANQKNMFFPYERELIELGFKIIK